MSPVPLTILCLLAYVVGVVLLWKVTPRLLSHKFDEMSFMGIAAADILGGLLVFAPVGVMFALFNGALGIRIVDFILLSIVAGISARLAYRSFFPWRNPNPLRSVEAVKVSSILAGSYCVLLGVAALYALVTVIVLPT
jgi:hypothetical protein